MSPADHAEDLARKLVNNHGSWTCFAWFDRPADAEQWAIVITLNRDSDALDRSNARVIDRAMAEHLGGEDCIEHDASHWAVGWVRGYAIRVYGAAGDVTDAFGAYAEFAAALEDYPVLDEEDYSEEEMREANAVWRDCFSTEGRIAYIRGHRRQFEFRCFADLLACVRGSFFCGDASELLS